MRTRIKANVIDATSSPINGAVLENNMPVLGGIVVPDIEGVQEPAIIVNGDQVYLFPIGRLFTITGGPNAGSYIVIAGTLGNGAQYNTFPLAPHIANTTEIPVAGVPSTTAGGTIVGFGIDSNDTFITDLLDPIASQDAVTKKYVDDQLILIILPLLSAIMPPGSVAAWSATAVGAPNGWLLCDGASYNSIADTSLATLFSNIGITYGGTGASNFNVPDLRGRFSLGKSNGSGSNRVNRANAQTLSNVDGDEGVTLTTLQIPAHSHGGTTSFEPSHKHSGSMAPNGGHAHNVHVLNKRSDFAGSTPERFADWTLKSEPLISGRLSTEPDHSHPITNVSNNGGHSHSLTINNTIGGSNPHNNVDPYITMQYIIKT